MRLGIAIGAALALLQASALQAQAADDEFSRNVTASFDAGAWRAQAASFKDYGYSPQRSCRVFTDGAMLTQTRRRESATLDAAWTFLDRERQGVDNLTIDWVRIDGRRYEIAMLPWRLAKPNEDGIILTFDLVLQSVRRDAADEWLPASYLTLPLLYAKRLEVGYSFSRDDQKQTGKRAIALSGFRQVAKWCGRELLRDRLGEQRVQELTK